MRRARLKVPQDRPYGYCHCVSRIVDRVFRLKEAEKEHFVKLMREYGFRYGKRAHQAVRAVDFAYREGYTQAVDCDLKSYFDTVNHSRLLRLLTPRVTDRRVLRLISRYLRAGVQMPEGHREATTRGVPQGGPLTPCTQWITIDISTAGVANSAHQRQTVADRDSVVHLDDDVFDQESEDFLSFGDAHGLCGLAKAGHKIA